MNSDNGDIVLARLGIFLALLFLFAACEWLWPLRRDVMRQGRWPVNGAITAINTVMLRVLFLALPSLPIAAAAFGAGQGAGLLPAIGAEGWIALAAGFLVLDLAVYLQHVAMHHVPWLWRLHRVHHADTGFDVTTALRFHPGEILISQVWKSVVVVLFGVPVIAAVVFEIVLNGSAMFSHANFSLPARVEPAVRAIAVTPDMHRIHHSVRADEANSNFGFSLSLWDRLFGTYCARPSERADMMPLGLASYRGTVTTQLVWLLRFPFQRGPSA
jgi:sterol desaturase/sphingolipid hydroxylase (fatty acid hydroxylase superfamily)